MKKKQLLLALALTVAGTGSSWGQLYRATTVVEGAVPANGSKVMIWDAYSIGLSGRDQNRTWLLYADKDATTCTSKFFGESQTSEDAPKITDVKADKGAIFEVGTDDDGNITFKSENTGLYVNTGAKGGAFVLGSTPTGYTLTPAAETASFEDLTNAWTIQDVTSADGFWWNGNFNSTSTWEVGHPFEFWNFEEISSYTVTYICKDENGNELKTSSISQEPGSKFAATAPDISLYKLVNMDMSTDTIELDENKTINCVYAEDFPFKASTIPDGSTTFPADTKWHLLTIAANKYYLAYTEGQEYIPVETTRTELTEITDNDLWAFTGNPKDGFKIYNKAAGPSMILSSSITPSADGNTGGNTYPILTPMSDIMDESNTAWDVSTGAFDGGYFLGQHGIAANRMNFRTPALAYWTGGADGGSTFTFSYYNVEHPNLQKLQDLMALVKVEMDAADNVGQPGYATQAAYDDLKDVYDNILDAYEAGGGDIAEDEALTWYDDLNAQYTDDYLTSMVTTPTEWMAYQIENLNGRGKVYFNPASTKYVFSTGKEDVSAEADNYNWVFVPTGDGNYYVYNVARGKFIAPTTDDSYGTAWAFTSKPTPITLTYLSDRAFSVRTTAESTYMSTSNSYNNPIITYYAEGDGGVPYLLKKQGLVSDAVKAAIDKALHPIGLTDGMVAQGFQTTGVGNKDAILLGISLEGTGSETTTLNKLYVTLKENTAANISALKLYSTTVDHFNDLPSTDKVLMGSVTPSGDAVTIPFDGLCEVKDAIVYLWLTADIKADATVGATLDATADSINYATTSVPNYTRKFDDGDPNYAMTVFSKQSFIFNPYANNCHYYRIPALTTAKNGDLVAAADMRYDSNGDLGSHKIDIAVRRSSDNGITWSEPTIIAVGDGSSDEAFGYGDPALVTTASGKIICLMAAGKNSFGTGIQHIAMCTSTDNGVTWDSPVDMASIDFTDELDDTWDLANRFSTFVTSGKGLLLTKGEHAGRIMFAVDCKPESGSTETNYILYSDNEGTSWYLGKNVAYTTANEAKLVEMNDGQVMLSVRQSGNRGFNTSDDGGITWGTQSRNSTLNGADCNADILYYSRETDGEADMMLHTLCNSTARQNLTLFASSDQGTTWATDITIQEGSAGYSTMIKCADGSVGIFFEDGSMSSAYTLTYVNIPASAIATAIEGVQADSTDLTEGEERYYDLNGRRIAKPTSKGLYITSKGRKILVK